MGRAKELNLRVIDGEAEIQLGAHLFHLSHYPRDIANKIPGRIHLHGHVHGLFKTRNGGLNVGVDVWGFAPISVEEILEARSNDHVVASAQE